MDAGKIIIETEIDTSKAKKQLAKFREFETVAEHVDYLNKRIDELNNKKIKLEGLNSSNKEVTNLIGKYEQIIKSLEITKSKMQSLTDAQFQKTGIAETIATEQDSINKQKIAEQYYELISKTTLEEKNQLGVLKQQEASNIHKVVAVREYAKAQEEVTQEVEETEGAFSGLRAMMEYALSTDLTEKEKAEIQEIIDLLNVMDQKGLENPDYFDSSEYLGDLAQLEAMAGRIDMSKVSGQLAGIDKQVDKIGNGITRAVKNVGRWVVGLFGIRSVYSAIRSAMSTISQYDKQLAADIEYMKNALAFALEPIIRVIINLVKQLMFYLGYIIKAWTGKNIFANANKGLQQATGSAKELKKQLAGFDEMNVLSDQSSSGSGGAAAPSMDLTNLEGDVPKWIQWIADNGEKVIAIIGGITGALVLLKLGINPLQSLGLGIMITGLLLLIGDIIKFLNDPTWDNFANILIDLAIVLGGVAIAMLAVKAASPVGWITLAIAAIVALTAVIIKNWDEIKAWFISAWNFIKNTFNSIITWIKTNFITPVANFFKGLWDGFVTSLNNATIKMKSIFAAVITYIKGIINNIISLFRAIGERGGEVIGGAFKVVVNGVLSAIERILNFPINSINKLIKVINKVPGINISKLSTFNLPRLAKGGIVNMPGKGVPVGGALAGEHRMEGVIPLTDSQQMSLLGEAIGKYITVNANITNTMNGRVISRELQKVQNNSDFAYNR